MNEDKLLEGIVRLSEILEKRTKAWNVFLTGVINGIGAAIGAALIGSLIVGLIASNISKIPILRDIVPRESFNQYIGDDN